MSRDAKCKVSIIIVVGVYLFFQLLLSYFIHHNQKIIAAQLEIDIITVQDFTINK